MNGADAVTELGFVVNVIEEMEGKGRWPDLSRLQARNPALLNGIVWMLGHDVPIRDICKALKVSPCTVQAVRESPHCNPAVVTEKARVTALMKLAFRLGVESLVEKAKKGKLSAFDLKLLWDMIQIDEGGVTQRVEVRMTEEDAESIRYFQEARRQPGMVCDVESISPTGAAVQPDPDASPLMLPTSGIEPPVARVQSIDIEMVIIEDGDHIAETRANRGGGESARAPTPDGGTIQPGQKIP